jgi:hypothetical protein
MQAILLMHGFAVCAGNNMGSYPNKVDKICVTGGMMFFVHGAINALKEGSRVHVDSDIFCINHIERIFHKRHI